MNLTTQYIMQYTYFLINSIVVNQYKLNNKYRLYLMMTFCEIHMIKHDLNKLRNEEIQMSRLIYCIHTISVDLQF